MRREESGDVGGAPPAEEGGRAEARRVRLPLCTWKGLLGFVAVMAAGAALVGEEGDPKGEGGGDVALSGHVGLVDTLRFSADGRTLLSSGWDKTVRIWALDDSEGEFGEELARFSTGIEVYAAAISPDGRTVAVAGLDGVSLWDWAEGGALRRPSRPLGVSRALAFSPDGRLLAVGGYDDGIHLVDVATGRVEASLRGHRDVIRKLAFADGGRLLSLSYDGRLKSWDVAARGESGAFGGLDDLGRPVLAFALSPDGRTVALSRLHETDGGVEIWDVARGALRATCRGEDSGEVHALAFSRDGGVLASCGSDLALRFWDPRTGRSAGVIEGTMGWIRTLDFSADGRWMATSSLPDEVRLRRIGLPRVPVAPATANAEGRPARRADAA